MSSGPRPRGRPRKKPRIQNANLRQYSRINHPRSELESDALPLHAVTRAPVETADPADIVDPNEGYRNGWNLRRERGSLKPAHKEYDGDGTNIKLEEFSVVHGEATEGLVNGLGKRRAMEGDDPRDKDWLPKKAKAPVKAGGDMSRRKPYVTGPVVANKSKRSQRRWAKTTVGQTSLTSFGVTGTASRRRDGSVKPVYKPATVPAEQAISPAVTPTIPSTADPAAVAVSIPAVATAESLP